MNSNAVCVFCDDAYFPVASILCRQLAAEERRDFDVILFIESRLETPPAAPTGAGFEVRAIQMDALIPAGSQWSSRISRAAYNRLFMGDLLEERYTKALYLDCDIAIWGPVSQLFTLDLGSAPLAAVQDCNFVKQPTDSLRGQWAAYLHSVEIQQPERYFNSGVLLADLTAWRQRDIKGLMGAYIARHGARMTGMDQDTLNFIFQGEWAELSPRWNFQLLCSGFGLERELDARIFHYVDNLKPWHDLVFNWGQHHIKDFDTRFRAASWPGFLVQARKREHYKRHAKWRVRNAMRWLPPVAKRFERENTRRRQYRDLTVDHVLRAIDENRYLDVRAGLTIVDRQKIENLRDNPIQGV